MIEATPDVNFWLNAARRDDTLGDAINRGNDYMQAIHFARSVGDRCGVRYHTGEHVLRNVRSALRQDEISRRGVTRFAWSNDDIEDFVQMIVLAVEATGGRSDVRTVSHEVALREYQLSGAPDAEDHQMVMLAANSPATVFATSDVDLLAVGEYQGVEFWESKELIDEVAATLRRMRRDAGERTK